MLQKSLIHCSLCKQDYQYLILFLPILPLLCLYYSVVSWTLLLNLFLSLVCFQPPVEFRNLTVTREYGIQAGDRLCGLCCDDSKLYCVERRLGTSWLAVYDISSTGDGNLPLLDRVGVRGADWDCHPRVDSSHRVYVPCGRGGVRVFRWEGGRLLPARTPLVCVAKARILAVNAFDSLYVVGSDTISLVNVSTDAVIRQLDRPDQVGYDRPYYVSVLGETALVCYGDNTLVTYHSDNPSPGQVLQTPPGLGYVYSITTDGHSSFLVTDSDSVFVLDATGDLRHRVQPGIHSGPLYDCAVVQPHLWLGYYEGPIAMMS